MTSPGPRFCGSCGRPVAATGALAFCTECGARLAGPATAAAAPVEPAAAPAYAAPVAPDGPQMTAAFPAGPVPLTSYPGAAPRRGRLVVGLTLGAVLLGGGGTAAAVLLGSDDAGTVSASGEVLAAPLDDTPERAWAFDAGMDSYLNSIVAAGDLMVVSLGESAVVGLEVSDGTERWRAPSGYAVAASPDGEQVLVTDLMSDGIAALSTRTGEEEWRFDFGYTADYLGETVLVVDDSTITVVDPDNGSELWDASSQLHRARGETVYSIAGGELRALEATDGTERWSQSIGYSEVLDLVAVDGMVVVQSDSVATAYAAEDGHQLWVTDDYAEYRTVEPVGVDAVAITEQYYDSVTPGSAAVYHPSGPVDTVSTEDGYLGITLLSAGGQTYARTSDGRVLDASLDVVARYDGYVVPVDGGVYVGDALGDVSYYRLPEDQPAWTESWGVSPESESYLLPVNGGVAVVEGNRITTYL